MNQVMGVVTCFAGPFIPRNWAACNGQTLLIADHPSLFKLLGTRYGGDGVHNFKLPDLRRRTAVSAGQSPFRNYGLGDAVGSESVTLDMGHFPSHSHSGTITLQLSATGDDAIDSAVKDAYPARQSGAYSTTRSTKKNSDNKDIDVTMARPAYTQVSIGNTGSGAPIDIRSPFFVITHIICLSGIFPSRS